MDGLSTRGSAPFPNVTAIGTAAEFKALRDKLLGDNFIADERRLTSRGIGAIPNLGGKAV